MAITATSCTIAVTTGILTLGSNISSGALVAGMTITASDITEPNSPAITLGSIISGTPGQSGATYNTAGAGGAAVASATFTFTLFRSATLYVPKPPPFLYTSLAVTTVPLSVPLVPPQPLPQTLFGSTTQTSFST